MNDTEVRAALLVRLDRRYQGAPATRIVQELELCQASARVDVAVINGRLVGWEIKSGADRLGRLPQQQVVYSRVFDRMWLVAEDRHLGTAEDLVPCWWGLMRATSSRRGCTFQVVRAPKTNPLPDLSAVVQLLWRAEALEELKRLDLATGLQRAPRRILWDRLVGAVPSSLTSAQLRARIRLRLKTREGWRAGVPRM